SAFALSTMFIAVPTGVKIFNWLGTIWKGDLHFRTPMLFALGFLAMFVIGGLSGVTHAIVPSDWEQTDTYYIVAHFHYVLFGGAMFGLFAAIYYWLPKATGWLLREGLGKLHFWLMFIGFNLTFGPFHLLGLEGMPRRIHTYPANMGWDFWNMVSTIGAFTIALSIAIFIVNVVVSRSRQQEAGADPWDGRTLEWTIPSPPPDFNFATIPLVKARDDFWHRKYVISPEGMPTPILAGGADAETHEAHDEHIHMPSPSYFPIVASLGAPLMAYGVVSLQPANLAAPSAPPNEIASVGLILVGAVVALLGFFGWVLEPSAADE
nr:cbb3-type cytochrome c oxidase subunit I [Actinomycetota bacterium]